METGYILVGAAKCGSMRGTEVSETPQMSAYEIGEIVKNGGKVLGLRWNLDRNLASLLVTRDAHGGTGSRGELPLKQGPQPTADHIKCWNKRRVRKSELYKSSIEFKEEKNAPHTG